MANYSQVSYGSEGGDVTELQKLLKNNGYTDLAVDGDFGPKTQAAVKDYQQKNGLAVDGIVGTNTWGALTGAQSGSSSGASDSTGTTTTPTQTETATPKFEYKPSDTVAQAEALLQQQMANKPGAYQSTWEGQLNDTISQILNREKFSYDLNEDALYQQYRDQHVNQGKLAMMDAMGQAAAMTGGYGNSYAQGAGQQAYLAYLQRLNDVVPELYGMALDQHNQEGQQLYDQASLLAGMEDQEYGRYQDQLSQYYTDLNYLTENARYMSETEYQKAMDDFNIKYGAHRDDVADQQWQAQFDEAKRQYDEQMALTKSKSSGGSTSSTGSTGNTGSKYSAEAAKKQQELKNAGYDVAVDGIWGPKSEAAWESYQSGVGEITDYTGINKFHSSIHSESEHDAVMRHMYGSYRQYVAEQIEKSNLSDNEKAYLISYYGIKESDTNYKPR